MTREEIKNNIGAIVTLNRRGDLGMSCLMRLLIESKQKLKIVKLTRGGLAYLDMMHCVSKYFISVPPKNVDLYEEMKGKEDDQL